MYFIHTKDIVENGTVWENAMKILSQKEKNIVKKYLYLKDKRLALASFILQRYCLSEHFKKPMKDFIIKKTNYGKPYVDTFFYNVSHDNEIVIIDCDSNQRIGIDIVYTKRPVNPRRI